MNFTFEPEVYFAFRARRAVRIAATRRGIAATPGERAAIASLKLNGDLGEAMLAGFAALGPIDWAEAGHG